MINIYKGLRKEDTIDSFKYDVMFFEKKEELRIIAKEATEEFLEYIPDDDFQWCSSNGKLHFHTDDEDFIYKELEEYIKDNVEYYIDHKISEIKLSKRSV